MDNLITTGGNSDRPTVIGRRLHEELEVETRYNDWFPRMCEYGLTEGVDFYSIFGESTGGHQSTDHQLTMDMAKEIAMLQLTEKGKEARPYFITVERVGTTPWPR